MKGKNLRAKSPKFTRTKIAYAGWSWNPITGCRHNCEYCYARTMAKRFKERFNNFEPIFHEERLQAPYNSKIPKTAKLRDKLIFVVSMGDMFGEWVEKEWIDKVLDVVRATPQWTYIFCTKNPQRLINIDFPMNAWVGATVDIQERVESTEQAFDKIKAGIKFLQCEPLLGNLTFTKWHLWDWLVIGPQTGRRKIQPQREWVESLVREARRSGAKIYMKPTLQIEKIKLIQEYPVF